MAEFLTTSGISAEVEKIINEAKQQIVLISPYLKISQRMKDLLIDADLQRRTVKIVFGKNELQPDESEWLQQRVSIRLFFRKNLHAKCYLNEQKAVVTSMNLYEFSQVNNDEMGILITAEKDPEIFAKVSEEAERLIRMSDGLRLTVEKVTPEAPPPPETPVTRRRTSKKSDPKGHCIRCADEIPLNPAKPYCEDDYETWAEYGNENYRDKYCHICGERYPATKRRPLCEDCYEQLTTG